MQKLPKNDMLYLLRMIEASEKIKVYSGEITEPLVFFDLNDQREFNACLTLLAQIGEQINKLSDDVKSENKNLDWEKIKDFRNRNVHDYTGIDKFITFEKIRNDIPNLIYDLTVIVRKNLESKIFDASEFELSNTSQYLKHIRFDEI